MSRIGRTPITVPAGVDVTIANANTITVKGPLGTMTHQFPICLTFERDGETINVKRSTDEQNDRAMHGMARTVLNNMIVGANEGYTKKLQIVGVGYKAAKSGKTLTLTLGHSHPIYFEEEESISFDVPDASTILVKGCDKQKVGQIAAEIRSMRPPEPYHGKGVKYEDERIRRKAGKAGK